jgi:hypothetical protein
MKAVRRGQSAGDEGAAALEFALILPLLLTLVLGMIEFGFVMQAQLALVHAAQEGARLASLNAYVQTKVEGYAFPLKTNPSHPALGLQVTASADASSVVVTAKYPLSDGGAAIPQLLPFLPHVTLKSTVTMYKEY